MHFEAAAVEAKIGSILVSSVYIYECEEFTKKIIENKVLNSRIIFKVNFKVNFKVKVKVTQSCPTLRPHGLYSPWNSPGQNTGVGSLSLLQGIFPTQGSNPGLPHCRWMLYQPSHKGSP